MITEDARRAAASAPPGGDGGGRLPRQDGPAIRPSWTSDVPRLRETK